MARASATLRAAVVCTVVWGSWLAAGPATADVGDPVDGAGGAGVVRDAVADAADPVGRLTGSAGRAVEDTVRTVTSTAESVAQEASPGAGGDPTEPVREAAAPPPDRPRAGAAGVTAPQSPSHAVPARRATHQGQPARERAAAGAQPVVDARAPKAPACRSASLAAGDLRRCARASGPASDVEVAGLTAERSLPGLGGVPTALVPAGLGMLGAGLVLVACGRRRDAVRPAT